MWLTVKDIEERLCAELLEQGGSNENKAHIIVTY